MGGTGVLRLDTSIVNVALPPMQQSLGLSPTGLQWVVSSYTLTFAGFLLLGWSPRHGVARGHQPLTAER